tara:strand:+ start:27002 stop:27565 length:564 start_codon:yes stop_codon:yes gene_type:complete
MATLTSPINAQNIIDRFADFAPASANSGIVWGTNSVPFSGFATSYFGGTTAGRSIGITGADINQNPITASVINTAIENETAAYSQIRNLNAIRTVTGPGGNTGTYPNPGQIFNQTAKAYLNSSYAQTLSAAGVTLTAGTQISASGLEAKFTDLQTRFNNLVSNTVTVNINICHASCHSSCHGSRGRR